MSYSKSAQMTVTPNRRHRNSFGSMIKGGPAPAPISNHAKKTNYRPDLPSLAEVQAKRMSAAMLVDSIFYFDGIEDCASESSDDDQYILDDNQPYQLELMLESNEDRTRQLQQSIRKFNNAYDRLAFYAVNWFYLMEEADDDEQIAKMVKDLQMYRKLSGGGNPTSE